MGWQPNKDDVPGAAPDSPVRDPRLAGFANGGEQGACRPSPELAAVLEAVAGPEWRCPGATKDEMLGLLRQAQAEESRAAAVKLGILRSLIRIKQSKGWKVTQSPPGWHQWQTPSGRTYVQEPKRYPA